MTRRRGDGRGLLRWGSAAGLLVEITGTAAYLACVALWAAIGLAPELDGRLPAVLRKFAEPAAWWPIAIAAASAATAVLLVQRAAPRLTRSGIAIGLLGISAALLGVTSYWPCSGEESLGWSALSRTFDLFGGTIDMPFGRTGEGCPSVIPLGLQAGHLMALAAITLLAARAIALVFTAGLARIRVRLAGRVVICTGVSADTLPALRRIRRGITDRQTLVILDRSGTSGRLVRDRRTVVVPIDYTDGTALRRLFGTWPAPVVDGMVLLDPDANQNLVALDALDAAARRSPRPSAVPGRIQVRIDNPWQADEWRHAHLVGRPGWLLDSVSAVETAARHVAADLRGREVDTVVVTGTSPFELSVLSVMSFEHRINRAVEPEGAAPLPRIVLAGDHAHDALLHLRSQLARFGIAEAEVRVDVHDGKVDDAMRGNRRPALLVGPQPSHDAIDATLLASLNPHWWIYAWDDDAHGVTTSPLVGGLLLVGPALEPLPGQGLDLWERFGIVAHTRYLARWLGGVPVPGDPTKGDWESDLSAFTRESNIRTFAAIAVTVGELGLRWRRSPSPVSTRTLTESQVEVLARLEHESWVHHHAEYGWRYAAKRDDRRRRHPLMVPWSELEEDARAKDHEAVVGTLELMSALGFTLERDAPPL